MAHQLKQIYLCLAHTQQSPTRAQPCRDVDDHTELGSGSARCGYGVLPRPPPFAPTVNSVRPARPLPSLQPLHVGAQLTVRVARGEAVVTASSPTGQTSSAICCTLHAQTPWHRPGSTLRPQAFFLLICFPSSTHPLPTHFSRPIPIPTPQDQSRRQSKQKPFLPHEWPRHKPLQNRAQRTVRGHNFVHDR